MNHLDHLQQEIAPLREQLLNHPIYERLTTLSALHTFMEHHVFAVWDFMSLLKTLQARLTCLSVPWRPAPNRLACRLINEIVLGEESDEAGDGSYASHFELYVSAMHDADASTDQIERFVDHLGRESDWRTSLQAAGSSAPIRDFLEATFQAIESGSDCAVASAFTFGREELLPDVFERIVTRLNQQSEGRLDRFEYYLQRHIELDGDEHGAMANRLVEELCGTDETRWQSARDAAANALTARLNLWNAVSGILEPDSPVEITETGSTAAAHLPE
ncbi:MAG: DUF3050 domain-containing protein [Planctomycetota bacterium]|jgi:hypothetical protein